MEGVTAPMVRRLESAGVDLVEIGIPFSDPLADGPVIQHSSHRVLERGFRIGQIFEIVRAIRVESEIPIVLMGYANSVRHYGVEKFFTACRDAGADGIILPDVPLEEMDKFVPFAQAAGIDFIPLVTPFSSAGRIRELSQMGSGFVYCVSVAGVTGARDSNYLSAETLSYLHRVREASMLPMMVGFGISKPEHLEFLAPVCDGFIVGSALIRAIGECETVDSAVETAGKFVEELKRGKK